MKALIIDDDSGIRLALAHFLRMRGYQTYEAGDGAAGLITAKRELPDVVFLDQRLPDIMGETLLPLLTAPEIGACAIMMTAYVELNEAVRAMKAGAEYFFPLSGLSHEPDGIKLHRFPDLYLQLEIP